MRSIALILILTGCGTAPSTSTNAPVADKTAPTTSTDPSADPVVPPETVVDSAGVYAVSLANVKELPECSAKSLKQLAYVKADAKFYSCETTGWAALEVVGAKGDKGDTGAAGPAGQVVTLPTNLWLDDVTHVTWFMGGHWIGSGACTGAYTYGSVDQVVAAVGHGLVAAFPGSPGAFITADPTIFVDTLGAQHATDANLFNLCVKN